MSASLFGAGSSPVDEALSGVTPIGSCGVPSGARRVARRWSRFRAGIVRRRAVRPQDLDPFGGLVRRMGRAHPPAAALRGRAAGVAVLPFGVAGRRAGTEHLRVKRTGGGGPLGAFCSRSSVPFGARTARPRCSLRDAPEPTRSIPFPLRREDGRARAAQPSGCGVSDPVSAILRDWRESYALGARQGQ